MNKFRLWISRNGFRVFIICAFLLMIYFFIKYLNDSYRDDLETQKQEVLSEIRETQKQEDSVLNRTEQEQIVKNSNLGQVVDTSIEYEKVSNVVNKILTYINQANLTTDNAQLKQDIYHMFSDALVEKLSGMPGSTFGADSILNFTFYVDDISQYTVQNVYTLNENRNVKRYLVELSYNNLNQTSLLSYLMINMDYDHNTFSYDGTFSQEEDITGNKKIEAIENKGSNTFE